MGVVIRNNRGEVMASLSKKNSDVIVSGSASDASC